MGIKEQVIREAIARIEKELEEFSFILNASPAQDILRLDMEVFGVMKGMSNNIKALEYLKKKKKERGSLVSLLLKQQELFLQIDRKVKLEMELATLKVELHRFEKGGRQ